jgi:DnaJ-class molecular chaperone
MAKKNPFTGSPYGTYEGHRGNADQWRQAFSERLSLDQAGEILGDDSPYTVLGLSIGDSIEVIKKAFRVAAKEFHPDRHPPEKKEWAAQEFRRIHAAYVALGGDT